MVFDIGPLTWVKSEIDSSLERARASLRAFAGGGATEAELKACQGNLHQAAGAVQIVGLEGVTRLFEETEALVGDLASGKGPGGADAIGALERAIAAIGKYLTELLHVAQGVNAAHVRHAEEPAACQRNLRDRGDRKHFADPGLQRAAAEAPWPGG